MKATENQAAWIRGYDAGTAVTAGRLILRLVALPVEAGARRAFLAGLAWGIEQQLKNTGPGPGGTPVTRDDVTMAVWQSPSGRLHLRTSCSGAGPASRMKQVNVSAADWDAADKCRCLHAWRPKPVADGAPGPAGLSKMFPIGGSR